MKLRVAALEKRKFAVTDRPRTRARAAQAGEDNGWTPTTSQHEKHPLRHVRAL